MVHNIYLLPHVLFNTAQHFKEKIALIIGENQYRYVDIERDSSLLSLFLKSKGVQRGDRVLVQAGNTYLSVIAYWAVLQCDACVCMIDHEADQDRLDFLIQDLEPTIILTNSITESQRNIYQSYLNRISIFHFNDDDDFLFFLTSLKNEHHLFLSENTEQNLAMIIYTSGSTSNPKGVMLTHRNVIAAIESISSYLSLSDSDIVLSILPFHFDYGLYQMLLCFYCGATLILENKHFLPIKLLHHIQTHRVTLLPCLPAIVTMLSVCFERFGGDYSSVLKITNTGEAISKNHIQQLKRIFPSTNIFSMYGLTECKRCSFVPPDWLDRKSDSIGKPIPNLNMWIEDEKSNPCQIGAEGELIISGPTVMAGYWKNSVETNQKIRINAHGQKELKTGDFATQDTDGFFYFTGRKDNVIKFKGMKLNPHVFCKKISELPSVIRSHVFVTPSSELFVCIESKIENHSFYSLKSTIYCLFPSYQQPSFIYVADAFPGLTNGKLDKHRLEKLALDDFLLH